MTNEYVTLSDGASAALAAEAFTYTYDASGNIIEIKKNGATLFRYAYDSLNQLVREDNRYTGKSYTWKYDEAGNILNRKTYAYTIDALGTVQNTVIYGYDNGSWGDLLISFNGQSIAYDGIGNPGTWNGSALTWQGRRLMSYGSNTYTYNADGIRTSKTVNGVEHIYHLSGTQILDEEWTEGNIRHLMVYVYDASGQPIGISHYTYNGTLVSENDYLLVSNIRGDIIGIYDSTGTRVVTYVYDAWGRILSTTGTGANTIGVYNPFRYRGYYYDTETSLYYLNSRYYDPAVGRFLNADIYINANGDLLGFNMFAYCGNNPVTRTDDGGAFWETVFDIISLGASVVEVCVNPTDPWAWAGLVGDVIDLIPFVTGVGEVTRAVKTVNKVADVVDTTHDIARTANRVENIVDTSASGIRYTDKVIKQMNNAADLNHSFPSIIDTLVDIKSGRPLKGKDGIIRNLVELPGSINDTLGFFEYIFEPDGWCNHRFFRKIR